MKKAILAIGLFLTPLVSKAATQIYIPSTSTFHNYTINIGSGTIRNLNASTFTATNFVVTNSTATKLFVSTLTASDVQISSGSASLTNLTSTGAVIGTMTVTGITISSGSADFARLTSTGAAIGTMTVTGMIVTESTFTRQIVGISTITNGTIQNANFGMGYTTGPWTWNGSTITNTAAIINGTKTDNSTSTYTGAQTFTSSVTLSGPIYTSAAIVPSSGTFLVSNGASAGPKLQWDGRINGPLSYSITAATSTTATTALIANTSLTGTFTTLSAAEKVIVNISGSCQAAAADGGSIGLKRDSTNVSGGTGGCLRLSNPLASAEQESCACTIVDTPGSVGTFTYTVTFNSTSGAAFQFGETNRASWLVITGYPK